MQGLLAATKHLHNLFLVSEIPLCLSYKLSTGKTWFTNGFDHQKITIYISILKCACVCMFGHHSQIESSKDLSSNNIGYVKLTFEAIQNHRRFSKCTVCNFWLNVTISSDIVRYWLWMAWTRFFLTLIWTPIFADESMLLLITKHRITEYEFDVFFFTS